MTDLDSRLRNWARCFKVIKHYSSCKSLEHKYKAPPIWHPPEPRIEVNIIDAQLIENALTNKAFPKKSREIIKYSYLTPYIHPMKISRKLGIRNGDIESELRNAVNNLASILAKKEQKIL